MCKIIPLAIALCIPFFLHGEELVAGYDNLFQYNLNRHAVVGTGVVGGDLGNGPILNVVEIYHFTQRSFITMDMYSDEELLQYLISNRYTIRDENGNIIKNKVQGEIEIITPLAYYPETELYLMVTKVNIEIDALPTRITIYRDNVLIYEGLVFDKLSI